MNTVKEYGQHLKELREEMMLMRQLATTTGFFNFYFKELGEQEDGKPKHRTQVECFNYCNEKYYDLFGEYRYSDIRTFKVSTSRLHKSKK